MHIVEETLDDLLHEVFRNILDKGKPVSTSSKGKNLELVGVSLQLTNPHARLSRAEMRSVLFSCLGETLWYLASSDKLEFISYYISRYAESAEADGRIWGAYGPRLFKMRQKINQFDSIIALLRKKPETRQAVIQLFNAEDILEAYKDIPCTCTLQFLLRENKLHMVTSMRSNDAYMGLPHDVFAFTFLQEIIARTIDAELGSYHHIAGSLHIYDRDLEGAKKYLSEDFQEKIAMPPMPNGTPWQNIEKIVAAEANIRIGKKIELNELGLADYWADLVRLLLLFASSKEGKDISNLRAEMKSKVFDIYIDKRSQAAGNKQADVR